jgi:hypothetical protein
VESRLSEQHCHAAGWSLAQRGKEVDLITNNLKTPYSDQISIGMRNKVGDWNTSAAIASVAAMTVWSSRLGNRYPNGAFWQNGSQPWGNGIPGFGSLIIGNNGLETKTTQVLLSAEKPYTKESGWGATFAYTYTHALQNNDNIDPTDQYAFDYETIGNYPFTGSGVPSIGWWLPAPSTVRGVSCSAPS